MPSRSTSTARPSAPAACCPTATSAAWRWRRNGVARGIGAEILTALIDEARQRGHREVVVSAQLQAVAFYREQGFVAEGKVYEDAGILHQKMRKPL